MNERPSDSETPTLTGVVPLKKKGLLSWLRRDRREEASAPSGSSSPVPPQNLAQVTSSVVIEETAGCLKENTAAPQAHQSESLGTITEESSAVPDAESAPAPSVPRPLATAGAAEISAAKRGVTADSGDTGVASQHWFLRLKTSLHRSSSRLTQGIVTLFTKRRLDSEALEELEELLIAADLGVTTAANLVANLARIHFNQEVNHSEIRFIIAENISKILEKVEKPLKIDHTAKPHIILVVGVNGSGKTTTIGKMARQFRDGGLQVSLVAGDTFRAAAVEQLMIWGERSGCPVMARSTGADAAGLAFDALKEARARGDDVLLIDTAGRLHNKGHLMPELEKIVRVLQKLAPAAPHTGLLVLDATVGQNAHRQVDVFRELTSVNSLAVTKLDGTARGGVLVALAEKFQLPVHYVGIGEKVEDLRPFSARDFSRGLLGLDA